MSEEFKMLVEFLEKPSLNEILFEEVEDSAKAISAAQKAFEKRNTQLQSLIGSLPSGKYKNVLSKLVQALDEGLKQSAENDDKVELDSEKAPDALASLSASYSSMNKAIKQVLTVNLNMMSSLSRTILDANLHKGEDKDIPMVTILEESDLLDDAKKELKSAFKKSGAKPIKPYKGFLATVMDALFGESEEVTDMANEILESEDELIDAILEMTPIEIGKFAQAITNYDANDKAAAEQIDSATKKATEEAGSDKVDSGDEEPAEEEDAGDDTVGATAKALRDKITGAVGEPGGLLFDKLLDSGIFKDIGIDIKESLEKYSLAPVLLEKKLSSDDFQAVLSTAIEDNKEAFDDFDLPKTVKGLNQLFKDEEIDLEIEEEPPKWSDLSDKDKRRAEVSFFIDGKYISGGTGGQRDLMSLLLLTLDQKGFEREDVDDIIVDFNRTFGDAFSIDDNTKAPSLSDIPELVDKFNTAADEREEYKKYKIDGTTGEQEGEELTGEDAELSPEEVEQSDQLADDAEKALGKLPFGKLELAKLLKAFPELAGSGNKATAQRRAFRKAFNQAANDEIFEEGANKEVNKTMSRLRILAGIK